jgi:hypothetical protein
MICYASSHHILNTSRAFRDHIKLKRICKKHVKSWTHLGPSEITICFTVLSKQRSVTPLSMFDANLQCETLQLWNVAKKSGTGVDHFEHLQRSWKVWWSLEKVHLHIRRVTRKAKAWRSRGRRFRELQEHLCMPRVTRKGKAWRSRGRRDLEESSSSSCSVIVAAKNSLHTNSYTAAMQIKTVSGAKSMPRRYSFSPQSPLLLLLLFPASVAPLKVAGFWRYPSFCFVLSIALQCNKQTTYRHLISISWCRIKQAPLQPITILPSKAHSHVTKNQKVKKMI